MPFLNWRQRTAVKAVEGALQYIKMYVTGVSANTAKPKYFKNVQESHSTSEQSLEQYFIVLLKL